MPSTPAPLYVIGLGPGAPDLLAPKALAALRKCHCIAGYNLYLELLPPDIKQGKRVVSNGMRKERERCHAAIDAAMAGEITAIVSSGDPGIYAMASLVLELLASQNLVETLPLEIIPGIPALCAAAAAVGAPIGHDFACVSLSDLLTPAATIEKRLHAVLAADFVCVLYNPRSHGRPHCLGNALAIARQYRNPDCPVALCRNMGRQGENAQVYSLADFNADACDMLSLIIIGNSQSRQIGEYMLTPRGYMAGQKDTV